MTKYSLLLCFLMFVPRPSVAEKDGVGAVSVLNKLYRFSNEHWRFQREWDCPDSRKHPGIYSSDVKYHLRQMYSSLPFWKGHYVEGLTEAAHILTRGSSSASLIFLGEVAAFVGRLATLLLDSFPAEPRIRYYGDTHDRPSRRGKYVLSDKGVLKPWPSLAHREPIEGKTFLRNLYLTLLFTKQLSKGIDLNHAWHSLFTASSTAQGNKKISKNQTAWLRKEQVIQLILLFSELYIKYKQQLKSMPDRYKGFSLSYLIALYRHYRMTLLEKTLARMREKGVDKKGGAHA